MQTVSPPIALHVEMKPFFTDEVPEVWTRFCADGFIGQGTFIDGQEYVALSDMMLAVHFYVGNGIIKEFTDRFGNYEGVTIDSVADYGYTLNDSSEYKVYFHEFRDNRFFRVHGNQTDETEILETPVIRYTVTGAGAENESN
jgi:hypothetical protein